MNKFSQYTRFWDNSLSASTEPMARSLINKVLAAAMWEVQEELKNVQSDNQQHLYLTMERWLKVTLSQEDEKLTITDEADYSFWYGNPADISTNLVVCEAKRLGDAGLGRHQLLGYMGR